MSLLNLLSFLQRAVVFCLFCVVLYRRQFLSKPTTKYSQCYSHNDNNNNSNDYSSNIGKSAFNLNEEESDEEELLHLVIETQKNFISAEMISKSLVVCMVINRIYQNINKYSYLNINLYKVNALCELLLILLPLNFYMYLCFYFLILNV